MSIAFVISSSRIQDNLYLELLVFSYICTRLLGLGLDDVQNNASFLKKELSLDPSGFILFPLVVHSFDLVISSVGILSIRGTRGSSMKTPIKDPMGILQKGYSVTIVLAVLTFGASTRWLLYTEQAPSAWLNFALCGLVGIITAYAFVWITKYYTDYKHEPVRSLALASSTGHGTNIIAGVSLGLESMSLPVLVISVGILVGSNLRTGG
ncbi:hypothetical protein LWI29_004745 [Acer saccharum]|uniref:H(+)-exporting diphosphatase n=1 Tax=Acer saccharum TaxID=4024 RepID=A0AA39SNT6_ACESA|nr:hypothetical protein LWI29_004745 [Acer saccharum]